MTVLIIGNWSLFDIWCLMLGISSLCRYLGVGYQGGRGGIIRPRKSGGFLSNVRKWEPRRDIG